MIIDLSDKISLVTGASGELGRVIARTLAECGSDVVVHYNSNAEKAGSLCEEIAAMGRKAIVVQADITDLTSVKKMQSNINAGLGQPDIIVNNAVIKYDWKQLLDQPLEDYEDQFRSCVLHNVIMAKVFVPAMIKKRWGRIIGINTECIFQCYSAQSAYVSGKQGMNAALLVLAKEVGKYNITVNQVAPGWMISEAVRREGSERQDAYEKMLPLKHRGEDKDIANAVVFLASDLARFITGVLLPVCGGGTTIPIGFGVD